MIRSGDWISTYTGRKFYPLDPIEEEIDIEDIAWALSMQVRFSGHAKERISVAQHSWYVSVLCDPRDALWGLLHDASEAYLVDLPTPLKSDPRLSFYKVAESNLMNVICRKFGLPIEEPRSVKHADRMMLRAEAEQFMHVFHAEWLEKLKTFPKPYFTISSWSQEKAFSLFLSEFKTLTKEN